MPAPPTEDGRFGDAAAAAAATEGTGRADDPEAEARVESGRISWEPPGLSTEERMLKMDVEIGGGE